MPRAEKSNAKQKDCNEKDKGPYNIFNSFEALFHIFIRFQDMLYAKKFDEEMSRVTKSRKGQVGQMNRNEKIRTYNWNRNSITDHRIGVYKQVPGLVEFFTGSGEAFNILSDLSEQALHEDRLQKLNELLDNFDK